MNGLNPIHSALLEDYRQRFEETQNNIKFRDASLSILVAAFFSCLEDGRRSNEFFLVVASPFFLFIAMFLYFRFLKANLRIADHMIKLEKRINEILEYYCPISPSNISSIYDDGNSFLQWMEKNSIIGRDGLFRLRWLLLPAIVTSAIPIVLMFSSADFCLNALSAKSNVLCLIAQIILSFLVVYRLCYHEYTDCKKIIEQRSEKPTCSGTTRNHISLIRSVMSYHTVLSSPSKLKILLVLQDEFVNGMKWVDLREATRIGSGKLREDLDTLFEFELIGKSEGTYKITRAGLHLLGKMEELEIY